MLVCQMHDIITSIDAGDFIILRNYKSDFGEDNREYLRSEKDRDISIDMLV